MVERQSGSDHRGGGSAAALSALGSAVGMLAANGLVAWMLPTEVPAEAIAGAVAALAAAIVWTVAPGPRRAAAVVLATVLPGLAVVGLAFAIDEYLSREGREIDQVIRDWSLVVSDQFNEELRLEQPAGFYGEGWGESGGGVLMLHGESERSHAVPWNLYDSYPQDDLHIQVWGQLTAGADETGCGLMFAFENEDSWWGMRVLGSGLVRISRFEGLRDGEITSRTFHSQSREPGVDVRRGVTFESIVRDGVYTFFVNDHQVATLEAEDLRDPQGGPAPFAIDSSSALKDTYECKFRSLEVRQNS